MLSRVAVPLTCFFVGSVVCWVLWLHRDTLCCFWPHFPAVAQMHLTRTKYACCWFTENVVLLQLIKLRDCFCADNRFSFKNIFRRKKKTTLSFRKLRGCVSPVVWREFWYPPRVYCLPFHEVICTLIRIAYTEEFQVESHLALVATNHWYSQSVLIPGGM